ncbi:MAG: hypothetical protein LBF13_03685 [Campylobacteraceae bacterium]|jgi:hypothetical protein|nr:hypothetical protein [Campylobacteraceae bacterium]
MKKFIFLLFTLLYCGCTAQNLSISLKKAGNGVLFKAANCENLLPLSYLGSSYYAGKINVKRSFYQSNESILVHEQGNLDSSFTFIVSLDSLTIFIFELKNPKITSLDNFYTYFEGTSRADKKIYIISAGIGPLETFDLLYSDDENIIKPLAECAKQGGEISLNAKNGSIKMPLSSYIRSDFSPMLFFKHNIASPRHKKSLFFPF